MELSQKRDEIASKAAKSVEDAMQTYGREAFCLGQEAALRGVVGAMEESEGPADEQLHDLRRWIDQRLEEPRS